MAYAIRLPYIENVRISGFPDAGAPTDGIHAQIDDFYIDNVECNAPVLLAGDRGYADLKMALESAPLDDRAVTVSGSNCFVRVRSAQSGAPSVEVTGGGNIIELVIEGSFGT